MTIRYLFVLVTFVLSLIASPSIGEIKAAVSANPALLNTPQAKSAMAEKGITLSEVKSKLNLDTPQEKSLKESVSDTSNDIKIEEVEVSDNKDKSFVKKSSLSNRINPFKFKSSNQLNIELSLKQQSLDFNRLNRYSSKFFVNRNKIDISSIPTPNDYIVSSGDSLVIYIYGDKDKQYTLDVSNDGTIKIPFLGPISIGGMKFIEVKKYLTAKLKKYFKLSEFYINMKKYSSIQVTLVGDVNAPGLYNLASFSTIKDLLIASHGVNSTASVRDIEIKRDGKILKNIDLYELFFKANSVSSTILKHGDIVLIKKAKKLVYIDGYVNNSAIFELKDNEKLSNLIKYAGGMKYNASKENIKVTRFLDNKRVKTFEISYAKSNYFNLSDNDKVYIYPLDFNAKESVNIYGNIIRPGSYNLPKEHTLNALLKSNIKNNNLKRFFLPQTYFDYAVIKRYSKDLKYETYSFSLFDVLENKIKVKLNSQDRIYIFSQTEIFTNSYITTKGTTLLKPGKFQYYDGMTIKDAINASGISGLIDDKVKVTTFNTKTFMPKTTFYSFKNDSDTKINPYDEIEVFDYYSTHVLEPISIKGEVVKTGVSYYYEDGMTLKNLLDMAGGFTNKAYTRQVEITRYYLDEKEVRKRKIINIDTSSKNFDKIKLKAYDEVMIFKIPQWNEKKVVEIKGEVKFPGKYTIETGEKLSSVIKRAGGFTKNAFVEGSVFTRESVRKNQMTQYNKTLARIKRQLAIFNAMPSNAKNTPTGTNSLSTLNEVMNEAKKYQPIGRISISLDKNITKIKDSEYDLTLENNDVLTIPSKVDTVTVFGEVFNPTSFIHQDGLDVEDYIKLASGFARGADEDRVYVIHANGMSEPAVSGWWIFSSYADIQKGDTVVVPMYIKEYNQIDLWESVSKIMASFAITAATLNTLGVF